MLLFKKKKNRITQCTHIFQVMILLAYVKDMPLEEGHALDKEKTVFFHLGM